jgi:hypothetical protein
MLRLRAIIGRHRRLRAITGRRHRPGTITVRHPRLLQGIGAGATIREAITRLSAIARAAGIASRFAAVLRRLRAAIIDLNVFPPEGTL